MSPFGWDPRDVHTRIPDIGALLNKQRWFATLAGLGLAAVLLAGCPAATETATVTTGSSGDGARLKAFAFNEMKQQARRTCSSIPRDVLSAAFFERSTAPPAGDDPSTYTNNYIALLYVEDIDINPIRLQSAAYRGCLEGLN